ncbi:hypothetical protein NIIDMKKI_28520 [Mycobacterium kansasii]|uniref:Uncharacterized protein n=1 Tax=Mycobacterium kansasii TaxID=1768 RepID=A0A7G1I9K4_MYCKA|nr:hypothetical protein NIIDMKKI_28520 [Mycobacterium kansasii]
MAAKYKRFLATERHHDSAICHIATILLTRIATCWRTGEHCVLRDTDGRPSPQSKDAASSAPAMQSTNKLASTPPTPVSPNAAKAGRAGNNRSRQALQFTGPSTSA